MDQFFETRIIISSRLVHREIIFTSDDTDITRFIYVMEQLWMFECSKFIYEVTIVSFSSNPCIRIFVDDTCTTLYSINFSRNCCSLLERSLVEWQEDRLSPLQTLWRNFMCNSYNSNVEKLFWNNINIYAQLTSRTQNYIHNRKIFTSYRYVKEFSKEETFPPPS